MSAADVVTAEELWELDQDGLLAALLGGHPIDESALEDRVFRGVSLGLPSALEKLTWKKFHKVFTRDDEGLRGWNVRLEQNGLDAADTPKIRRGERFTFGHFRVRPTTHDDRPRYRKQRLRLDRALMLDYGLGGNGLDPVAALRDPIVAVNPGDSSLLLGWSYLQLGPLMVPTPSFFTLKDAGPRDHLAVTAG